MILMIYKIIINDNIVLKVIFKHLIMRDLKLYSTEIVCTCVAQKFSISFSYHCDFSFSYVNIYHPILKSLALRFFFYDVK